jgi:hypothetical protein
MKARERRRRQREAIESALRQKEVLDHWKKTALNWRNVAASLGSKQAELEIIAENAEKDMYASVIKQMYSDDVDYRKGMVGLAKMLEFMEPPPC